MDGDAADDEGDIKSEVELNNNDLETGTNIPSNTKEEEVPDELIKKKKARIQKPFTEEDLTSKAGIKLIYKTFPDKCKHYGQPNHEGKDLNNLINLYKEWAFRLYPGLAFNDILSRTEGFGSRGSVKIELTKLRELERKRYLVIKIKQILISIIQRFLLFDNFLGWNSQAA